MDKCESLSYDSIGSVNDAIVNPPFWIGQIQIGLIDGHIEILFAQLTSCHDTLTKNIKSCSIGAIIAKLNEVAKNRKL